ncbi:hypothetical protein GN956_G23152 [Arapaima gigas]
MHVGSRSRTFHSRSCVGGATGSRSGRDGVFNSRRCHHFGESVPQTAREEPRRPPRSHCRSCQPSVSVWFYTNEIL